MDPQDHGRYLPRGGHTIEVDKTEDAFTALVPDAQAVERLQADEDVESVQPLEGDVFRVTVKTPEDRSSVEQRDELMARLRSAPAMVVHHEYRASQQPESVYQITDEIIVKFGPEVDDARIAAILAEAGVVVKKQYEQLQQTYLVQVTDAAGANPLKVANRLGSLPEVEYAEPSLVNRLVQFSFPRDDLFPQQWHLYSKNQVAPDVDRLADASVYEAWQITKGVRNVVVAVLDDGFELSHPDFQGPGKVVHPADFRGGDDRPLPGRTDYHGTPCAGVAIAEENGQGCVGVAPGCAFMPVRIPLSAPDPWFIEIFGYVSQRANVASCSWGMPPGDYPLNSAVRDAVAELAARGGKDGKGLAIVFAAGNYDAPLDSTVDYDIRWLGTDALGQQRLLTISGRILNGFAAHPDTIAVGAFTSLNRKALYSNWGRQITVTAPSNNFDPTTMAGLPGRGITTTDNEYYGEDFTPGKRYTDSFGGTSSATPLVAGVAALVKSANPALTAPEVKAILEQTADKIEDPSVDPLYGHAKGTFQEGASEWFGSGKVNAYRAVLEAVNRLPGGQHFEAENATAVSIPDFPGPAVASTIQVPVSLMANGIEVTVDIRHPWIGDLVVSLRSPQGQVVRLHDRQGFRQRDLRRTFTVADTPSLAALLDLPTQGPWTLMVQDRARRDEGRLNGWTLRLASGRPAPVPGAAMAPAAPEADFTVIHGIGPIYAARLTAAGITTFEQLASLSDEELDSVIKPRRFQRLDFASWRRQAATGF